MDEEVTYGVRVYAIERRANAKGTVTSYRVSWKVGSLPTFKESFKKFAQADSFRSALQTAASRGEAFSRRTGRPVSWGRQEASTSWLEHSLAYTKVKWRDASPNHRRGIAEALIDAMEAVVEKKPPFTNDQQRAALRWAYGDRLRTGAAEPPPELRPVLDWLDASTVPMETFNGDDGRARARAILERLSSTKSGERASANTYNRKRAVVSNLFAYARERGLVQGNPFDAVTWTPPRTLTTVDPRSVINTEQAQRLLLAVREHSKRGRRMEGFFACMYYAGLRPEECVDLRREHLVFPPAGSDDEAWGEFLLTDATPRSGSRWTNSGRPRERRALKHRAEGDTRRPPMHPELVRILRRHLEEFATGPGGRVFVGPRGGTMTDRAYLKVFHEARAKAFTAEEAASPLAERPYDLRHAALSTWLNNGVDIPQVAEWAGNSPQVLMRVYAKCIHGAKAAALRRVWEATRRS